MLYSHSGLVALFSERTQQLLVVRMGRLRRGGPSIVVNAAELSPVVHHVDLDTSGLSAQIRWTLDERRVEERVGALPVVEWLTVLDRVPVLPSISDHYAVEKRPVPGQTVITFLRFGTHVVFMLDGEYASHDPRHEPRYHLAANGMDVLAVRRHHLDMRPCLESLCANPMLPAAVKLPAVLRKEADHAAPVQTEPKSTSSLARVLSRLALSAQAAPRPKTTSTPVAAPPASPSPPADAMLLFHTQVRLSDKELAYELNLVVSQTTNTVVRATCAGKQLRLDRVSVYIDAHDMHIDVSIVQARGRGSYAILRHEAIGSVALDPVEAAYSYQGGCAHAYRLRNHVWSVVRDGHGLPQSELEAFRWDDAGAVPVVLACDRLPGVWRRV
jgi:hypothetical protein